MNLRIAGGKKEQSRIPADRIDCHQRRPRRRGVTGVVARKDDLVSPAGQIEQQVLGGPGQRDPGRIKDGRVDGIGRRSLCIERRSQPDDRILSGCRVLEQAKRRLGTGACELFQVVAGQSGGRECLQMQ
ncbi:MAG TPA: hypothetical protein ENK89_02265, partial [Desulfobulbaceae bacterium]|nr:hypothetical protein [Desulfobulbaceae bacterium]